MKLKGKKRRVRFSSARVFFSSFGGKIEKFSNRCYGESITKLTGACVFVASVIRAIVITRNVIVKIVCTENCKFMQIILKL